MNTKRKEKQSLVGVIKRRTFELLFNTWISFPESNVINWLIVLIETIQITFYPLRRALRMYWSPPSFFDISIYITYIINPALIVGENWTLYIALFSALISITGLIIVLMLLGIYSEFLRQRCIVFQVILKTLMKLSATVLFIPCFTMYGNSLRCTTENGVLSWKVFPNYTCFTGIHNGIVAMGVVGAFFHLLVALIYYSVFWDSKVRSNNMFAKHTNSTDMYKLLMLSLISLCFLLIDSSLNVLIAVSFVTLMIFNIYLLLNTYSYYNLITMKIMIISHYLPVLSGGTLLLSMVFYETLKLDTFFILFVGIPFISCLAFANTSENEVLDPMALIEFGNVARTIGMLRVLQHMSLYEMNNSHAHKFSLSGFIFQHLKRCPNANCKLIDAVIAYGSLNLQSDMNSDNLARIINHFINEIHLMMQSKNPDNFSIRIPYYIFLYEVQGKTYQVLLEINKASGFKKSFSEQYLLYKIKKSVKNQLKDDKSEKDLLQTKIACFSFLFQNKIEECANSYMELWSNLISRKRDLEEIKQSYERILLSREKIKKKWSQFRDVIGKVDNTMAYYVQFIKNVEGNSNKAFKLMQKTHEKVQQENEDQSEKTVKEDGSGFLRVSAGIKDNGKILDCNYCFCKMFGVKKESILRSNISQMIPKFLQKKHNKEMLATLADSSVLVVKKDKCLVGMHSSGYLIPVRISVTKQMSLTESSQFFVKFIEIQYDTPSILIVTNDDQEIEAASSEIITWFRINQAALTQSRINICELVPLLKGQKLSDYIGKKKLVKAMLRNQKKPQNVSGIDINEKLKLNPSTRINDYFLEMTVDQISFKEQREGYIVCLKIPPGNFDDFDPVELPVSVNFNFNHKQHVYIRSKSERFKMLRGDQAKSFFFRDSASNFSERNIKSSHEIMVSSIEEARITEQNVYKCICVQTLQEVLSIISKNAYEDDYAELNEIFEKINSRKDFGESIKLKLLPNSPACKDETQRANTNIIRCWEEESGNINRINKAREIEKKFKERKIQSVLLSNKETRKAVEEANKSFSLIVASVIIMITYLAVPLTLAFITFEQCSRTYSEIWTITQYGAYNYEFASESTEAMSTAMLIALINEGRINNFGILAKNSYISMLRDRFNKTKGRLTEILGKLHTTELALLTNSRYAFIKGAKANNISYSMFGEGSGSYSVISHLETREVLLSMISKMNAQKTMDINTSTNGYKFLMTNLEAFINPHTTEVNKITTMSDLKILESQNINSSYINSAWSVIILECILFCIVDYIRERKLQAILSLFFSFNSDQVEEQFNKTKNFLQKVYTIVADHKSQNGKDEQGKKNERKSEHEVSYEHDRKKARNYRAKSNILNIIVFNIILISPYIGILAAIYVINQTWFASFSSIRSEYQLINSYTANFERACLYSSLMYTRESREYALKTSDLGVSIRTNIQSINQGHFSQIWKYTSNLNDAYISITQDGIGKYTTELQNVNANILSPTNLTTSTISDNWGKEGLFEFTTYGLQLLRERVDNYLGGNTTKGRKYVDKINDVDFIEYYYLSAFIIKPSCLYISRLLQEFIENRSYAWTVMIMGLIVALIVYAALYLVFMISYLSYQRANYNSYCSFYTIIPKELRKQNAALENHIKQLTNIT